jgi:hypothetical protein
VSEESSACSRVELQLAGLYDAFRETPKDIKYISFLVLIVWF